MLTSEVNSDFQFQLIATKPSKVKSLTEIAQSVLDNTKYQVIENPHSFCKSYRSRIKEECQDLSIQPRILEYGIFDASEISLPKVKDSNLVFYAKNMHNGIPYKVIWDQSTHHLSYELLPYENSCT